MNEALVRQGFIFVSFRELRCRFAKKKLSRLIYKSEKEFIQNLDAMAMMGNELETLSNWFILNAGYNVYGMCPVCFSQRIAYHKERKNRI